MIIGVLELNLCLSVMFILKVGLSNGVSDKGPTFPDMQK